MSMQAITTVAVHMTQPDGGPVIHAVQEDTGRAAWFSVLDMEVPESAAAYLYAQKPDGTMVYNDCSIRQIDGMATICAPLTAQLLAVSGRATCQIQIVDGGSLVTSFPFEVDIGATRVDGAAIESSNEFGVLVQATEQAEHAARLATEATEKLQEKEAQFVLVDDIISAEIIDEMMTEQ